LFTCSPHKLTFSIRPASGFVPQNSLGSSETSSFRPRSPDKNKQPRSNLPRSGWSNSHGDFSSPIVDFKFPSPISEIGNSTSLLSYNTPGSTTFAFGDRQPSTTTTESPIPFVFGVSKHSQSQSNRNAKDTRMVNERSPAKPLRPVVPNNQSPQMSQGVNPTKPAISNAPQFGQSSLPQSPLPKISQKHSDMFIQPKARPEHHREDPRQGRSVVMRVGLGH
jgi:hypothetical protein